MKLSVIIPTYKRNDFLPRAIESIVSQNKKVPIVIIDDNDAGSIYRQKNIELMKKYKHYKNILYVKHPNNKNGATARNTGLKYISTEYVTFLDDDDEFCENRIAEIEKAIKYKKPDFICSGVQFKINNKIDHECIPDLNKNIRELQYELLCIRSFFGTGSNIVCKTETAKKIGGFDERFSRNQDIEFMIRYLNECKTLYCVKKNLIIKNMDSLINIPDFDKMLNVKMMLLDKYSDIIKTYSETERIEIYRSNFYELLRNAIRKQSKTDRQKAITLLKEKHLYSFRKVVLIRTKLFIKKEIQQLRKSIFNNERKR